jgi:hypothetical protein
MTYQRVSKAPLLAFLPYAAALTATLASPRANATPQPLPFSYVYETLPEGSLEVEQYIDLTPVRVFTTSGTPPTVITLASQFQTEFEYGITDRLELGLYATFVPVPPVGSAAGTPSMTEGNGAKERLRLRLADEGRWPVDVGLYGEVVENDHEFELEAKVILQRRIGDLRVVANLWGEHEWNYASSAQDWVMNPTLGATYQVTPVFQPGIEAWLRAEFPSPSPPSRSFNLGPQVYVGPTCLLNFGKLWWSTGVYIRTTDFTHSLDPAAPDAFGIVWARTIVGLSL